MLEHLTRYFTAAHRIRRSERTLVRSGAALELEELRQETNNPKLKAKINAALNDHAARCRAA